MIFALGFASLSLASADQRNNSAPLAGSPALPAASASPTAHNDVMALPDGISLPRYAPGPVPFHISDRLVYRISWIGIPAAQAIVTISQGKEAGVQTAEVWLSTNRLVDVFYKARDYLRENFNARSLAPRDIYIHQQENARIYEYNIGFDRADAFVTTIRRSDRDAEAWRFRAAYPFGPISGAMMALSQPLQIGHKLTFDIFAGRHRAVIDFSVDRRERIATPLGNLDAIRIIPTVVYISDESIARKARRIVFWVAADPPHTPLRIEAAAFIGTLRADLVADGRSGADKPR